jgi:uncharacterized OB-fold protein
MSTPTLADWTRGEPGITYQRCPTCEAIWYFRRDFCPRCGGREPSVRQASGRGTVHAVSLVHRAPTEALRVYAPYLVALIDADEGFRLMAHGDPSLRIADRVHARFRTFGDELIPYFEKSAE